MGFEQYHEPANELSQETRTFARMITSLTEEAEAIGWYEQRISMEQNAQARAIMANSQQEEFKHFGMDLEFLLRIKLIASLRRNRETDTLEARVEPTGLALGDPLARVDGVMNAITIHTDTLPEVTVIGPGAGRLQTGQGLLADLIAIAKTKQ